MAEFSQNVWSLLTTENAEIIDYLLFPFSILEPLTSILLFTTILKINNSKKQIVKFVLSFFILGNIINFFVPTPYNNFINIFLMPSLILLIFKTSILKSVMAQILQYFLSFFIGTSLLNLYTTIFDITANQVENIFIYRFSLCIIQQLIMYILYKYAKKNQLNIDLLENINRKTNTILLFNFLVGIVAIGIQSFIITEYNNYIPLGINIASIIILIAYFGMNLYNLSRTTKLEKTEQVLEEEKAYNKTITVMYDNIRAFRHDFNNIVQAIGRFYCHRRY